MPQIFIDGTHVGGFDDLAALEQATPEQIGADVKKEVIECVRTI